MYYIQKMSSNQHGSSFSYPSLMIHKYIFVNDQISIHSVMETAFSRLITLVFFSFIAGAYLLPFCFFLETYIVFIGTNSPSSPLSCSSPKLLLSPQQGPLSLQNHYPSKYSESIIVL